MKSLSAKSVAGAGAFAAASLSSVALAGALYFGAPGVGDPYFPKMGNGGYDAIAYEATLTYRKPGDIRAVTTIEAVADTDGGVPASGPPLGRFNLDFRGPGVTKVLVGGAEAEWMRMGQELRITPSTPIADGASFETMIKYAGVPERSLNPDGSRDGWTETTDGVVALGEPQAVPTFLPVSDHPTDKALWQIELRVPQKLTGISNGLLAGDVDREEHRTVTRWVSKEPMASYLAMIAIGRFQVKQGTIRGIPYLAAIDAAFKRSILRSLLQKTRKAHRFMEEVAGPYPFSSTGGIVDPSAIGFALENQTRSYYPNPPGISLVVHEVSHQWFGDSVSVSAWDEIWLNEGFATYMEWLYDEETGGTTAADRFASLYASNRAGSAFWDPPPADPGGPQNLFDNTVYVRGAMALQVLREEIGDADFREVLYEWAQGNEGGNVSTQDLYDLIEAVTGEPRPDSLHEWLYTPGKPACPTC